MPLKDKKVLLGVTGSIAAYKAADLVQRLKEAGAAVKVVQTEASTRIINPITFSSLTGFKTAVASFNPDAEQPMQHIDLARWADIYLIAPCTGNTLAELSYGLTQSLVSLIYLCFQKQVFIAPAMNPSMYEAPATLENLLRLKTKGDTILPTQYGDMACGETGEGKLLPPEIIIEYLKAGLSKSRSYPLLRGKKCLLALGHTEEKIDDIRYIANRSSGKTGLAIARALVLAGAEVTLIQGKMSEPEPVDFTGRVAVQTTADFENDLHKKFSHCDICLMTAALADFVPKTQVPGKIKNSKLLKNIELTSSSKILSSLGTQKKPSQLLVGFALENPDTLETGVRKAAEAACDLLVLNAPAAPGKNAGFGRSEVLAEVLDPSKDKASPTLPRISKYKLADNLLSRLNSLF